nr:hypothetical protein [Tanacetum cinerariifolium]
MVRDIIQLENAVSTISQEYLLEFSSEYGIPETLHPELLGPEESIMEFPEYAKIFPIVMEWRTNAPKDEIPSVDMDLFSLISALNLAKVKTETRPRAATDCHRKPCNRDGRYSRGVRILGDTFRRREVTARLCLGRPTSKYPWREIHSSKLDAGSAFYMSTAQDALAVAKSVSDPYVLSYVKSQSHPERDIAKSPPGMLLRYATLKIPVYPEVHDPKDPQSFKKEILLKDAITANISRVEKKKRCLVVCRTHGVSFAHHARSDSVLVSVSTVAPQGLAILLAYAGIYAFANVMSAVISKGMSEGLAHGIEHGKAGRDLKYPIVDQLKSLKDAPIEVIMASLYLESDSGEDAPEWIRDLPPSTSQFKIPVYLEVRDPRDPWAVKDEMLLEEAIAANVSRAEKKKSVGWFAVPMWSVPPIMLDLTASLYRCLPLLLKVLRSYWRMLLHRQRHPKMMLLQDC